jgi:hypothetical protein
LVVSEPPASAADRWPTGPLLEMGLRAERLDVEGIGFVVLEKVGSTPEWAPRRVGRPAKRPWF